MKVTFQPNAERFLQNAFGAPIPTPGGTPGTELLTAWVALSDVTSDAGPVRFVPGSQRWGLLEQGDFYAQDHNARRAAVRVPEGERGEEVEATLPPGA